MTLQEMIDYASKKPAAKHEYKIEWECDVVTVGGKIFMMGLASRGVTLKCDPILADELRRKYKSVTPGYYTNKMHWNTISLDGEVPGDELMMLTDLSYNLVVKSLTKKLRSEIGV